MRALEDFGEPAFLIVPSDHHRLDARIWKESDIRREGISIESVLSAIREQGARARLVVVDASRRNPSDDALPRSASRSVAPRPTSLPVSSRTTPSDLATPLDATPPGPTDYSARFAPSRTHPFRLRNPTLTDPPQPIRLLCSVRPAAGPLAAPRPSRLLSASRSLTNPPQPDYPQRPSAPHPTVLIWPYEYRWNRLGRKRAWCRVLARGTMNSALVEFPDGYRIVTSRNAIRKR